MTTVRALFAGYDASGHTNLWVTDGTAAGTSKLTAVGAASGLNPSGITVLGTKALFECFDASNRVELWVSDGTSAGTTELTPVGANSLGLFGGPPGLLNPDFTILGGKLLIQGLDTSNKWGLWVTDGTSAGTSELIAGASSGGLFSGGLFPDFTVLGNKALFDAVDASGFENLWVTDGTSTGTSELTVVGAYSGGLFHGSITPDFTVLGNKAIFEGDDASGHLNLWTTDGTAAGTSELSVAGASSFGPFNGVPHPSITALGTKAFFIGTDANNQSGLWVTDGTSGGTSELAGGNLFAFIINPHFTALGSKMLFMGTELFAGTFHDNLWVTDGTAAGTSELAVAGANSLGLLAGDNTLDTDFISLGAKAVFKGEDASGHENLWVTDGTVAGTSELTVAGAYAGGLFNSAVDPDFTAFGGRALFLGSDASGHPDLWVTDGTSAGTSEVMVAGAYSNGLTPSDITVLGTPTTAPPVLTSDFNNDGHSDLLWQNSSGQVVIWEMSGATIIASGSAGNPGPDWHAVGTGDFNGDHLSDILFQNSTGQVVIWEQSGATVIASGSAGNPGPSWHAVATGDFNGDGLSDILFQNSTGEVVIWEMSGATVIASGDAGNPGPSWHALGTGDFNGDGRADILWQNDSGQAAIWEMNGTNVIGTASIGNPGPDWHILGTGDYNNDGKSDILWQNSSGAVAVWEMNGTSVLAAATIANPGPTWHV